MVSAYSSPFQIEKFINSKTPRELLFGKAEEELQNLLKLNIIENQERAEFFGTEQPLRSQSQPVFCSISIPENPERDTSISTSPPLRSSNPVIFNPSFQGEDVYLGDSHPTSSYKIGNLRRRVVFE
jgi:hypothetical protein